MKLHYYSETDDLHVRLNDGRRTETIEIADGFLVDLAEDGSVVGFDIEYASKKVDLSGVDMISFPLKAAA